LDVLSDFVELAVALAKHARHRLACKPLRFDPTDTTRIIEGRPVQALSAPCLTFRRRAREEYGCQDTGGSACGGLFGRDASGGLEAGSRCGWG